MKTKWISCLLTVGLLVFYTCGCATGKDDSGVKGPKRAQKVKVAMLDSENRTPTSTIEMPSAQQLASRPYKTIAVLSSAGDIDDEAEHIEALVWHARALGGNGIIVERTGKRAYQISTTWTPWAGSSDDVTFRAQVIVWSD
jgi:hypothetical protein